MARSAHLGLYAEIKAFPEHATYPGTFRSILVVPLPKRLIVPLRAQLAVAQAIHAADLKAGFGRVSLPYALSVKYPKADREWAWQYVFPLQNFRTIRGLATPSGTTCLTRIWKMPSSKLR